MGKEKIISVAEPKVIAGGLGFGEGPLWHKDGFLIFSDVKKNRIMKLDNGKLETFLEESGCTGAPSEMQSDQRGANGIAYDHNGNLIFCQHGNHSIARLRGDGTVEIMVDSYNGKRLNSPNDLCVGPDGSIYFSDPPYGIKDKKIQPDHAQPVAGVYRWFEGALELLTSEFDYPNGVCFSPDYKYLYIGSNAPDEKRIVRYDVRKGILFNRILFAEENADGIKTDHEGNLYLATMEGIVILSPAGQRIAFIEMPEMATNICLYDGQMYVTAEKKVYLIPLEA